VASRSFAGVARSINNSGPACAFVVLLRHRLRAYFFKTSARHSLGDAPKRVRNDLLKCDRSLNPQL
jgi:hypothetical protein